MKTLSVEQLKKLRAFFSRKKGIHTALLFGSFATNRVRPSSDVDIAVLLEKGVEMPWGDQAKMSLKLDGICHREVDLVILNTAAPHLAFRAIREGKILFQKKNHLFWNQFVVRTFSMNEDMKILYAKVGRG